MRLLAFIFCLVAIQVNAQPLWRNFFTTNQNPRVTVVAGSNATVQASTVGTDQRIFTVNAVPGAGGAQTNISWTAITNLTSAQMPLSVITNAGYLTNWALIPTNFVPAESNHSTNADFVVTATLTNQLYASNIVSGGQVPIAALSPNAGADGWFLIQSNSAAVWGLNGASLTNVPFTFWTNYTSNPNDSTNLNGLAYGSGMYGMTSYWGYATAPGVGPIGIFYNGIDTNTVITTNGGSFYGAILDLSASSIAPGSNQLVTASWVRNLFSASGSAYYNSTNIDSGATNADMANQYVYKYQSTIPISDSRVYSTADFLTNSGYVGAVITTNRFSYLSGAILVNSYFAYTGGSASPTLLIKPEIYISSDGTNWYSEVAASPQSITYGTTNLFQWLVDFPATSATNATGFLLQRRFKITGITGSGTRTLRVFIGTNAISGTADAAHLTMQSPTATAGNAYLANNQAFTGSNYFSQALNGTFPPPTNAPTSGKMIYATSASSSKWDTAPSGSGSSNIVDVGTGVYLTNNATGTNIFGGTNWIGWVSGTNAGIYVETNRLQFRNSAGNGTNIFYVNQATGALLWNTDSLNNIGASGANRPYNLYVGGLIEAASTVYGGAGLLTGAGVRMASAGEIEFGQVNRSVISSPANGSLLVRYGAGSLGSKFYINGPVKALSDASAIGLFTITSRTNSFCGGDISYTIMCQDATPDNQVVSGFVTYAAANTNGVWYAVITENTSDQSKAATAGTIVPTWSAAAASSGGTTNLTISVSADTSLTPAANQFYILWQIRNNGTNAVTAL